MFQHIKIDGKIKQATIKKDKANRYFATFIVEEVNNNINYSEFPYNPVGIDVGLLKLIATTDNTPVDPPKYLRKSEKKLKRAQRSLSRKQKGSENRREMRVRVAKISIGFIFLYCCLFYFSIYFYMLEHPYFSYL